MKIEMVVVYIYGYAILDIVLDLKFGRNSKNEQENVVVMTFKFYLFLSNIAFIDFVYFCNE